MMMTNPREIQRAVPRNNTVRPRSGRTKARHISLPTPHRRPQLPIPPPLSETSSYARSERSPSQGPDSRRASRISFADLPRPTHRLQIPTKTESLAGGFPFDPRLNKYGVTEDEWHRFASELVDAADVPGPSWAWAFNRKEVIKRIKKELQYEGELKRVLRRWNRGFKRKGFQAWLELPASKGDKVYQGDEWDSKEDMEQAKRDAKRFRIVVTPAHEKAPSVYSRSSSLTRSVSGEGLTRSRSTSGQGSPTLQFKVPESTARQTEDKAIEA